MTRDRLPAPRHSLALRLTALLAVSAAAWLLPPAPVAAARPPANDVGYGFDNIGDVLSLSPLLFEKYLGATERIVDKAFEGELAPPAPTQRWADRDNKTTKNDATYRDRTAVSVTDGDLFVTFI